MTVSPQVTVMIPTYNQCEFLEIAIRSALAQDYRNLEVLVADDASSDRTEKVVSKFLPDPRLKYVRRSTNIGRVRNYRMCLTQDATGDLVLCLDGDDYFTEFDAISTLASEFILNPEIVLAFGSVVQGAVTCNQGVALGRAMSGSQFFLQHPPFRKVGFFHMATMYRRDAAIQVGFYTQEILSSDFESFYRLILGRKLSFVDKVVGVWRQHSGNASKALDVYDLAKNLQVFISPYKYAKNGEFIERVRLEVWLCDSTAVYTLQVCKALVRAGNLASILVFLCLVARAVPGAIFFAPVAIGRYLISKSFVLLKKKLPGPSLSSTYNTNRH